AVLAVLKHPDRWKPLVQTDGGTLHDGSHLDGELPLFMPAAALAAQLLLQEADFFTATPRSHDAVFPLGPTRHDIVKTVLLIREVNDCFLEGLGFVNGFHTRSLTQKHVLRKYIIADPSTSFGMTGAVFHLVMSLGMTGV